MADAGVRELVDTFVTKLEQLIRDEIRRGFEAAIGGSAPARRGRPPGRPAASAPAPAASKKFASPSRKKGEKRSPEQIAAVQTALADYIAKTPGQRIEEIGRALKLPTKDLTRPISKLIAGKKVKTTGQKRATKYFPR